MWRDARFWAALTAAVVFWGVLFAVVRPVLAWDWPLQYPLAFVLPALVYPVLEEIVFRGGLQEVLQRYFRGRAIGPVSLANVGTSVVFTALHFCGPRPCSYRRLSLVISRTATAADRAARVLQHGVLLAVCRAGLRVSGVQTEFLPDLGSCLGAVEGIEMQSRGVGGQQPLA